MIWAWACACICEQGRIWLDGRVRCQIAGLGREQAGRAGLVGGGDASGSMQRQTRMSPQSSRPSRLWSCWWLQAVRCGLCCGLRFAAAAEGDDGRVPVLQCRAGGRTRQGRKTGHTEGGQGMAVRRIEGFEKRRGAKPKRCLAHPPGFVRAFQDPPTPLGECRVAPAMPCPAMCFLRA